MMRKYLSESIVLLAFVFLLGSFLYQRGMARKLDASLERSRTAVRQIDEIKIYQKVWSVKGLKGKIASVRNMVSASNVKLFDQKKKKLQANFTDLSGKELNDVATKIATLPVQIGEFAVTRSGSQYAIRCTCSW